MTTSKRRALPITNEEEAQVQASIASDPDNPEASDAELARMRPAVEVLPPGLFAALTKRGRPKAENSKVLLTLRLDPHVIEAYKSTGPGWQTRMNEWLAEGAARVRTRTLDD